MTVHIILHWAGADINILKGGASNNESTHTKIFRPCPLFLITPTKPSQNDTNAAERLVFDVFGVIFVVNLMIDPSLWVLHWLGGGGARVHFCTEKAY